MMKMSSGAGSTLLDVGMQPLPLLDTEPELLVLEVAPPAPAGGPPPMEPELVCPPVLLLAELPLVSAAPDVPVDWSVMTDPEQAAMCPNAPRLSAIKMPTFEESRRRNVAPPPACREPAAGPC